MTEREEGIRDGIQACMNWLLARGLFQVADLLRKEMAGQEEDATNG